MKKQVISVALFAVLATMAVSCQKENLVEPQTTVSEIGTVRTVSYAVDGVAHQVTLWRCGVGCICRQHDVSLRTRVRCPYHQ